MLKLMIHVFLFSAGAILAVQLLAAFFSIIDLRYALRRNIARIIRPILGWSLLCTAFIIISGPLYRNSFLMGIAAFGLFNLLFFITGKIVTWARLRNALKK